MDVQVVGPICMTGYGVVTANLVAAMLKQNPNVSLVSMGQRDTSWFDPNVAEAISEATRNEAKRRSKPDYTLCIWHEWDHPPTHIVNVSDKYIAMPTFELSQVRPDAISCLRNCHRVLVSSRHCEAVLRAQGLENAHMEWFHGVNTNIFRPASVSGELVFRMLNVGKLEYRKGHDVCIRALAWALAQDYHVELWAMWSNPFLQDQQAAQLTTKWINDACNEFGIPSKDLREKIRVVTPKWGPRDVAAIMNCAHIGLYPYRAEGWNLPLLETIACGKWVIATEYSGPADYLDPAMGWLINGRPTMANDGIWFGPGKNEGLWIEPDFQEITTGIRGAYHWWLDRYLGVNSYSVIKAEGLTWDKAATRVLSWLESGCELSSSTTRLPG